MGHHRRAEDADRDVEHLPVAEDLGVRHEAGGDGGHVGLREPDLDRERARDQDDQRDDERFDVAEAVLLQEEDDEHVERREAHAPDERQAEEQVEGDGGADDLGEVAGGDGDLAEQPEHDRRRPGVVVAAGLGEIAAAGDAEADGERLQQDRHQVGDHDDAEERVAEAGAAGEVSCPIAGVHVADGDEVARAGEREEFAPESGAFGHRDRAMDLGQAQRNRRAGATRSGAARLFRWSQPQF